MKTQTFTIISLLPDAFWDGSMRDATIVNHVIDKSALEASRQEQKRIATDRTIADPNDVEIIAVFQGEHSDQYEYKPFQE